jgi:GTPase KRas protein
LLVYSVTDRTSFTSITEIYTRVCRVKDIDDPHSHQQAQRLLPVVLVANKVDLVEKRDVTRTEGEQLAARLGGMPYLEVSAKKRLNIEEAFIAVVEEIRRFREAVAAAAAGDDTATAPAPKPATANQRQQWPCCLLC